MNVLGKEYGLLFSVGAEQEIAALCPEGDMRRIRDLFQGTTGDALAKTTRLCCILSRWYEKREAFLTPGYEEAPLTPELVQLLSVSEFQQLQAEGMKALLDGAGQTVEAEAAKKGKAPRSN